MAPIFKIVPEEEEADDSGKCCKKGKHIFTNSDGEGGDKGDSFTFMCIFARYYNSTHTFMFRLPLDTWAFYEEHGIHPIAHAHETLFRWANEIEGLHPHEIMEIFGEISCMNGRYITWKQIKQADRDSSDWWKKT